MQIAITAGVAVAAGGVAMILFQGALGPAWITAGLFLAVGVAIQIPPKPKSKPAEK
ncbi:hypothetical protein ACIRPH_31160 [Nocardiopsis sp. NPDC101807]|uniref:hypothetical protein n=1 Tax=Nocardiopsis sp. NPDC101807 TaxID=3364339 RepID=UPI003829A555